MSTATTSKTEKIFHIILAIIIIGPIIGISAYIINAKNMVVEELAELTVQREAAFVQARPAFMQYKKEHGVFPDALQQLAPDYMSSVPVALQSPEDEFPMMAIKYKPAGENAYFHYHTSFGGSVTVVYDIEKNTTFHK
jgi:hypothetical protein